MKKLYLTIALLCPSLYAQTAPTLKTQIASESTALEAKVHADPKYAEFHNSLLRIKKEIKAAKDPVEAHSAQTAADIYADILEAHIANDPKYKDSYRHIDTLVDQLKTAQPTDNTRRHHYVSNMEPK